MQAVISLNGKQYSVEEGRYVKVDSLSKAENEVFTIDNILMVVDGEQSLLGAPFVEGATATAKVLSHGRDAKVLVYKMRCKKGYRRKNGHRQGFTMIQIDSLAYPGKKDSPKAEKAAPAPKAKKADAEPDAEKPAKKAAPKASSEKEATAKKPAAKKAAPKTEEAAE